MNNPFTLLLITLFYSILFGVTVLLCTSLANYIYVLAISSILINILFVLDSRNFENIDNTHFVLIKTLIMIVGMSLVLWGVYFQWL
jgi:hypothetical protein